MSTPVNGDGLVRPPAKLKGISRLALSRLAQLLLARHWEPGASLEPLLHRGGAVASMCAGRRRGAAYPAATAVLIERWGSGSLDDLSYEAITAWYGELQAAPEQSNPRAAQIHAVLETTLRVAAVERDTGGQVSAMTRNVLPVWRLNGGPSPTGAFAALLMRRSGRRGAADSLAMSLPTERAMDLWMVSGQLHFSDSLGLVPKLLWSCEASQVESIRKGPRLQLLSRVTVRFADGSRAAFMAQKRFAIAATQILASR